MQAIRSIVASIYNSTTMAVFDLIVKETEVRGAVAENVLATQLHIPLRTVRITCRNLRNNGFVLMTDTFYWFSLEHASHSALDMCRQIRVLVETKDTQMFECKTCGSSKKVEDVLKELMADNAPLCCGEEMNECVGSHRLSTELSALIERLTHPQLG